MIEPLSLSYEIDCPADHAFEVWTTRLSTWWPKGHSASGHPDTVITLEPRLGGRIFERTPDGTEIDWGRITVWEPPARLGYRWHIGREEDEATEVALSFIALDDQRTRLEILHSGWEVLGSEGPSWRDANTRGWGSVIPSFVDAATGTA